MRLLAGMFALLALTACASQIRSENSGQQSFAPPTQRLPWMLIGDIYLDGVAAKNAVDHALSIAERTEKRVVIVVGTESCHDTQALLQWLKQIGVRTRYGNEFEFVLVESGKKDRNLDLIAAYGVKAIEGTPGILVLDKDGNLVNPGHVFDLRTAASQTPEQLKVWFDGYRPRKIYP